MKGYPVLIVMGLLLAASSCFAQHQAAQSNADAREPSPATHYASESQRTGATATADGSGPMLFNPMDPNLFDDISTYDWDITLQTYDNSQSPLKIIVRATYMYYLEQDGKALGGVMYDIAGGSHDRVFKYFFPSTQTFFDIIDYVAAHRAFFCDHSEYNGAEFGKYILPSGTDEYFILSATGSSIHTPGREESIVKGIIPGQSNPPEVVYVIEKCRLLRDEILQYGTLL